MQTEGAVIKSADGRRLPVNPRRHKVAPEQRKRVVTACNSCNLRRIKCSGEKPCRQCHSSSRDCHYPTTIERVTVTRSEFDDLKRRCEALERCLQEAVPDADKRNELLARADLQTTPALSEPASKSSPQVKLEDPNSDEQAASAGGHAHEADDDAHCVAEAAGSTFLDYLKEFMTTVFPLAFSEPWPPNSHNGAAFAGPLGSYQTYDSRPLYVPDVDPLWLPPRADMMTMLTSLRSLIQDGNGEFRSGGIYWWGDLNSVPVDPRTPSPDLPPDLDKYRHLAFYHTAFAVARHAGIFPVVSIDPIVPTSESYFARARKLLGDPLDITRYTISDVAVLALMGYYLIEMNRRDAAYMYVSVAMHISIMHGAHRGWVDERGKRVFWTLYILDRSLSCLMGRPPTVLDNAIRLPLPREEPSLPPADGLRAHVKLSRISGQIVGNTYRIAPWEQNLASATGHLDNAMQLLDGWMKDLPPSLQMPSDRFSSDPSCCALHMAYNQLLLLTVRPVFFIVVKKSFAERYVSRRWSIEHHANLHHVRACSNAGRRNLQLARWLLSISHIPKLLQAGLHQIFNAAIVLMLQEMVCTNLAPTDVDDIMFAIQIFEQEARQGSSYGVDCLRILQDLRSLVSRLKVPPTEPIGTLRPEGPPGTRGVAFVASDPTTKMTSPIVGAPPVLDGLSTSSAGIAVPYQISEGDALYQELITWMENDDMQLYATGNYLL